MAAMIRADVLEKRFGSHVVLDRLSFEVERGERVAVLGLNGAGKTTLLRCVMGLLSFDGSIEIAGVDVGRAGKRARRLLGYVPQRPPVFSMSLGTMVEFFAALREIPPAAVAERLEAFDLPLSETGHLAPSELSGGMLQKALLALALAADPPLLLLDEPTANLDPRARGDFLRAVRQVGRETTILLASHRLDEVEVVADRIWILHGGGLAFDGDLDELRRRAGAESWLWVRTGRESRDRARRQLVDLAGEGAVIANGTHVAARLGPDDRVEALSELKRVGVAIEDFWVVGPSLEEIVGGFFGDEVEIERGDVV